MQNKKNRALVFKLGEAIGRLPISYDYSYVGMLVNKFGFKVTEEAINKFEKSNISKKRKQKLYVGYIMNICKTIVEKKAKENKLENTTLKDIMGRTKSL